MTALAAADRLSSTTAGRSGRLLVCYLPVGDPEASCATPAFYAEHGVDVVEAGLPVPDPVLDGPEVSSSMARAIAAETDARTATDSLRDGLAFATEVACVWMSYHPTPDRGYLDRVRASGAGGILLPDTDQVALVGLTTASGLAAVPFLDHTPSEAQVEAAAQATSYVMVAAANGVTGERATVAPDNGTLIESLRARGVTAPILLGFGLSSPDHVRQAMALGADGVVVGSACVRAAREGAASLSRLLGDLRGALDAT